MKVVILAGGLGSRLSEETEVKPKPMVEIGGRPILWHIMQHYAYYCFNEFFIALGYKGEIIKRYFLDYQSLSGSMTIDFAEGKVERYEQESEDWIVHLMDTGIEANTGGRIKRLESKLKDGTFMVTYGDGLCNVNLEDLLKFHHSHGRIATITGVRPPARFGGLVFDGDLITEFVEKPQIGEGWINGGFMVFEPAIFDYLSGDADSLEADSLEQLARERQLAAYRHEKFWQCVDTLRDVRLLQSLWKENSAPWKVWE
ncbi:MAG: glucose-1-phosphate cytidylyltransferase [Acidobacteria bacterium 13_1_20CM_3_53_8]|nr:MAG: glucose-1-phosphate cytidylyltransferase [Acidobacteria bacterium 13_1_20CM_3_53_8]